MCARLLPIPDVYNQVLYIPFMQDGRNALHLAAMCGHINTIQYLAPKMASLLHSTDHHGFTMLHWAAEAGHAEVVRILIKEYNLDPTVGVKVSFMCSKSIWVHGCKCVYSSMLSLMVSTFLSKCQLIGLS